MSHAATILIQCCDELMVHIGQVKMKDPATPATHWAPMLDRILDTRHAIFTADKQISQNNTTKTTKKP